MASKGSDGLRIAGKTAQVKGSKVLLVKTAWNSHITNALEEGCRSELERHGVECKVLTVPGAVEIPFAIKHYAEITVPRPDAYIALGCVIKGDTPHFEYVCQSVTQGITLLNTQLSRPVIFGVLTVNTEEQALERIGGIHGHKGKEAAETAIAMMELIKNGMV